jgi:hypothetical protein
MKLLRILWFLLTLAALAGGGRVVVEVVEMSTDIEKWMRSRTLGPELLAALRELVTLCQEDPSFRDPEHEPDSYAALVHAEQVIALAEGREP